LSQNWLILNRLCLRPSTSHTLLIEIEALPIVLVPMILPNWLPPNFTFPPSFIARVRNIDFSPVMCLEHPLSRYHDLCFSFALRHICSIDNFRFRYPLVYASFGLVLEGLLFTSCTLCCELDCFWLTNTLGLTPFHFGFQEATIVLFFWAFDFKISDSVFSRLWGTGSAFFRILIFKVPGSEFTIALGLEFFGFEVILALELEASGSN